MPRSHLAMALAGALFLGLPADAHGQAEDLSAQIEELRGAVRALERRGRAQDRRIEELEAALEAATADPASIAPTSPTAPTAAAATTTPTPSTGQEALDAAIADLEVRPAQPAPTGDLWAKQAGGARLRLIDVSLDALIAAGSSTESDEALQDLQGGGHDPRKRGFTVQNVELSLTGAVDPYFTAETHVIYFLDPLEGESKFELEEAFLTTQALPYGLQLEAGQIFTEFGRINPRHPHAWDWLDQPVINSRIFGGDGMRGPGMRLGWLTPLPWFSELHYGVQNASGETMVSFLANEEVFEERPVGGRPFTDRDVESPNDLVHLARWNNARDLGDAWSAALGVSGLYGPNATGEGGETYVYGADVVAKWRPNRTVRGWPLLVWQSEVIARSYRADGFVAEGDPDDPADDVAFVRDTLDDWGIYTQLLYGFRPGWATGVRYEYADGSGANFEATSGTMTGREEDPTRNRRHRVSPLLAWHPSEFSRLRLQYSYDDAEHLEGQDAHSVWLGLEFLHGAHAAHVY